MSLTVSPQLYNLLALQGSAASRAPLTASECNEKTAEKKNLPVLSDDGKHFENPGTKLKSETQENLDGGGTRRTQVFEQEDGRTFTRVEDFSLTERSARRTVYQQNPSGSITQYEEVLDRLPGGGFRRTQRFQDETGETSVQITPDYKVTDAFVLSGGNIPRSTPLPFASSRGTQLDLSA